MLPLAEHRKASMPPGDVFVGTRASARVSDREIRRLQGPSRTDYTAYTAVHIKAKWSGCGQCYNRQQYLDVRWGAGAGAARVIGRFCCCCCLHRDVFVVFSVLDRPEGNSSASMPSWCP